LRETGPPTCGRSLPRVRAAPPSSLADCAQDDAGIEVGLAAHESAGYLRLRATLDDKVEPLARRIRDGDKHGLGASRAEDPVDLVRTAEHRNTLETPAAKPRVVVHEADDHLAGRLAELAHEAPSGASGADDERAPTLRPPEQRTERTERGPLPEPRRPDQDGADQRVDDEDAPREAAPH